MRAHENKDDHPRHALRPGGAGAARFFAAGALRLLGAGALQPRGAGAPWRIPLVISAILLLIGLLPGTGPSDAAGLPSGAHKGSSARAQGNRAAVDPVRPGAPRPGATVEAVRPGASRPGSGARPRGSRRSGAAHSPGGGGPAAARTHTGADRHPSASPPPGPIAPAPDYPAGRVHSPLTPDVVAHLRTLVATRPGPDEHVFIKVGDSHTATWLTLRCFASRRFRPAALAAFPGLEATRAFFSARLPTGHTPFGRKSRAARGGHHAAWALGSARYSPLRRELAQLNPRFALVAFGTNDMYLYRTAHRSLRPFLRAMTGILERLLARGVIPIVVGLPPRLDSDAARRWAVVYNRETRRLAARHLVPFVDMHAALRGAPRFGLSPDGIHGTVLNTDRVRACDFSPRGLRHGYNVRNLVLLQALDRVRRAALPPVGPEGPGARTASAPRAPGALVAGDPSARSGDLAAR